MKMDAKGLLAIAAIITALSGAVELRVQVGLLAAKIDRIEARLDSVQRTASHEE